MNIKILNIKDLNLSFSLNGKLFPVIQNISFSLAKSEILGVVGESGSGKSICFQSITKLTPSPPLKYISGQILFDGTDLFIKKEKDLIPYRGEKIGYIFQDPMTALNPTMTVGKQILESLKVKSKEKVYSILEEVGIDSEKHTFFKKYPHELSGGERQRIMIAIAIAMNPQILIADEPTTALDVTIQAQVLSLLKEIQKNRGASIIFISHDLKVISSIANRIIVMYAGKIVEEAPTCTLLNDAKHPYTQMLLKSIPTLSTTSTHLYNISGAAPDITSISCGCSFAKRCPYAEKICFKKEPPLDKINNIQKVACWKYKKNKKNT